MDELDPAILRPGRLRFFKEFERIPRDRAARMADHYSLRLPEGTDFTLAELFACPNLQTLGSSQSFKFTENIRLLSTQKAHHPGVLQKLFHVTACEGEV
jgi:hypothetical protein